jgi:hypothetical protein
MLGVGYNIMKGELLPTKHPHVESYGEQLVDDDASKITPNGTFLGTVSEVGVDTYGWQRYSADDDGTVLGGNVGLSWNCSNDSLMKNTLRDSHDLSRDLTNGEDYRIVLDIAFSFTDSNLRIKLWDYSGASKYLTDYGTETNASNAKIWGSSNYSDGDVVRVWADFEKIATGHPYVHIEGVSAANQSANEFIILKNVYVGEKIG